MASGWEIWLPLVAGAAVCIAPADVSSDPNLMSAYINDTA